MLQDSISKPLCFPQMGSSQTLLLEVTGGDNVARDYVLGSSPDRGASVWASQPQGS